MTRAACGAATPCPGRGPACCMACRMYGPRNADAALRERRLEDVDTTPRHLQEVPT